MSNVRKFVLKELTFAKFDILVFVIFDLLALVDLLDYIKFFKFLTLSPSIFILLLTLILLLVTKALRVAISVPIILNIEINRAPILLNLLIKQK